MPPAYHPLQWSAAHCGSGEEVLQQLLSIKVVEDCVLDVSDALLTFVVAPPVGSMGGRPALFCTFRRHIEDIAIDYWISSSGSDGVATTSLPLLLD